MSDRIVTVSAGIKAGTRSRGIRNDRRDFNHPVRQEHLLQQQHTIKLIALLLLCFTIIYMFTNVSTFSSSRIVPPSGRTRVWPGCAGFSGPECSKEMLHGKYLPSLHSEDIQMIVTSLSEEMPCRSVNKSTKLECK